MHIEPTAASCFYCGAATAELVCDACAAAMPAHAPAGDPEFMPEPRRARFRVAHTGTLLAVATATLDLLRAVAIDAARPGPLTGASVRVRYNSAARAEGPEPRWQRVGPGEITGRVDNLHAPSAIHEQGTVMVYGDGGTPYGGPVVALRFYEINDVELARQD